MVVVLLKNGNNLKKSNFFKAFVVENSKITFSSFNFKDGLAISGNDTCADFSGTVIYSNSKLFKPMQKVILNGCIGEKHTGGFSQIAR